MSAAFPVLAAEWTIAVRRRRLLYFNIGIPLLLVLPLGLGGAPSFHASAAYAVLFVFFGTFGSAIPLLRDAESGPLRRIVLSGFPGPAFVAERVLAGTVLDVLQLAPAMIAALVIGGASGGAGATIGAGPGTWVAGLAALILAILTANLVGLWLAALARSIAEGALLGAVVSLFLLHGAGVFRTPTPGSVGAIVETLVPYRALHELFLAGTGAGAPFPGGAEMLPGAGVTLLLLAATMALGDPLLERVSTPGR